MTVSNKPPRWIWIGGWALPPEWLREQADRAFPSCEHTVLAPGPEAIKSINWSKFERACGYSLGAFLLLKEAGNIPLPALLIAPFFAYPAEAGLGGRIREAQLRYLSRWLRRDPCEALEDFYKRANLDLAPPDDVPYPVEDLHWGLDQLSKGRVAPQLPESWAGIIGDEDPLLDVSILRAAESRLQVAPGAGHHPAALMQAIAL